MKAPNLRPIYSWRDLVIDGERAEDLMKKKMSLWGRFRYWLREKRK